MQREQIAFANMNCLYFLEEIEFLNGCSSVLCALVGGGQTTVDKAQHLLSCESGENQLFVLFVHLVPRFHARLISDLLT